MAKKADRKTKRKPTAAKRKKLAEQVVEEVSEAEVDEIPLTHKYRPRRLEDFAGQEQAIEVVRTAFESGKVPRAWIIEGQTGTGKTTMTRFISMRINCKKPKGANPCLRCDSCQRYMAYPAPTHPAHVEVNAANARGIDDVRAIIASTKFQVLTGNARVVNLDEFHAATSHAQEALLKPLEDPSSSTYWVLSTTDPGKLKKTILGRCRAGHLRIRPPTTVELAKRLDYIAKQEGVKGIPKKWLKKIAIGSNHQPRDAIAVLEQVLNAVRRKGTKKVDFEKMLPRIVDEVQAGNPDRVAMEVVAAVLGDSPTAAHKAVVQAGMDAAVLIGAMCRIWRQAIIACTSRSLLEPYYARTMFRVFEDYDVEIGPDDVGPLILGGEYLTKQYERAKQYVVPGDFLLTMTVAGLWDTASIATDDEEGED